MTPGADQRQHSDAGWPTGRTQACYRRRQRWTFAGASPGSLPRRVLGDYSSVSPAVLGEGAREQRLAPRLGRSILPRVGDL